MKMRTKKNIIDNCMECGDKLVIPKYHYKGAYKVIETFKYCINCDNMFINFEKVIYKVKK